MDKKFLSSYKNIISAAVIIIAFSIMAQSIFSHYNLKKGQVEAKIRELENRSLIAARWKRLKAEKEELNKKFLAEDVLFFKKFVEEKANDLGITITSLKTSSDEQELYYWETTMQLGITCSYEDFVNFIKAIEEKSISVKTVTISNNSRTNRTEVNLTLTGFILKK
jgi:Tfp pilus assembly protein PilO